MRNWLVNRIWVSPCWMFRFWEWKKNKLISVFEAYTTNRSVTRHKCKVWRANRLNELLKEFWDLFISRKWETKDSLHNWSMVSSCKAASPRLERAQRKTGRLAKQRKHWHSQYSSFGSNPAFILHYFTCASGVDKLNKGNRCVFFSFSRTLRR